MAGSDLPSIFVGMPVYRGWDFLDEALRSIQDQAFQAYRVLMSVDGGDQRSAEICSKYTKDSRFELLLHPDRLGWANHIKGLSG